MSDVALLDCVTEPTAHPDAWRAIVKGVACLLIAALPCRAWPIASAVVRAISPGFRDA